MPALARDTSALPHVENACNDACRWWMSLGQQTSNQPMTRDTSYQAIVPENFNIPPASNPKSTGDEKRAETPRPMTSRAERANKRVPDVLPPERASFFRDTYLWGSLLPGSAPVLSASFEN